LFLLDSVSTDADFVNSINVPEGFVEDALAIQPPKEKTLYIKLRNDPATIDTVALPLPSRGHKAFSWKSGSSRARKLLQSNLALASGLRFEGTISGPVAVYSPFFSWPTSWIS
jgi:hypothetical protein